MKHRDGSFRFTHRPPVSAKPRETLPKLLETLLLAPAKPGGTVLLRFTKGNRRTVPIRFADKASSLQKVPETTGTVLFVSPDIGAVLRCYIHRIAGLDVIGLIELIGQRKQPIDAAAAYGMFVVQ